MVTGRLGLSLSYDILKGFWQHTWDMLTAHRLRNTAWFLEDSCRVKPIIKISFLNWSRSKTQKISNECKLVLGDQNFKGIKNFLNSKKPFQK